MGKITLFFLILIIVLVYPIYEIMTEKVIKHSKIPQNLTLVTIEKGNFDKYDINISKKGSFNKLYVYKNYYDVRDLKIYDYEKKETFFSKKTKLLADFFYGYDFFYKNNEYNFTSDFVEYNVKSKTFKGNKFTLQAKSFKAKGTKFFIDSHRNIRAYNPIFDLKVNE